MSDRVREPLSKKFLLPMEQSLYEAVIEVAYEEGVSASAFIRMAIRDSLEVENAGS